MNVVYTLLPVTFVKLRNRFQLHDNFVVTHKVGLEDVVENNTIVSNMVLFLPLIRNTPLFGLYFKSILINLLREPLAKHLMHLHGCTYDGKRFILIYDSVLSHPPVYF